MPLDGFGLMGMLRVVISDKKPATLWVHPHLVAPDLIEPFGAIEGAGALTTGAVFAAVPRRGRKHERQIRMWDVKLARIV